MQIGKTKYRFKKIGDIKGYLHAKMVKIKNRNGKDLTEAEKIKERWVIEDIAVIYVREYFAYVFL